MSGERSNAPGEGRVVPYLFVGGFDPQKWREGAFRACEALDERYFTPEALDGCIRDFARHIVDLADAYALLNEVAHRAYHLLDDSGEVPDSDDIVHDARDHQRLSDALDRLEASGWDGCEPTKQSDDTSAPQ